MKIKNNLYIGLIVLFSLSFVKAIAQVNPPLSMYYLNEYLFNPAVAGKQQGASIGLSYKNNLTGENGDNVANSVSVEYGKGKNGFGLLAVIAKDGILDANKFLASYSYNLKFDEGNNLRFGLSAGVSSLKANVGNIIGDLDDPQIGLFNESAFNFNGDFGVNYSFKKFEFSAVAANFMDLINDDVKSAHLANNQYYLAASYVAFNNLVLTLTPKLVYRGLKHYDDIFDVGVNAQFYEDKFNLLAMYHSNDNISVGAGFNLFQRCKLQASYSVPINNNMQKYTYGGLEIGLKANLTK